MKRVFAAALLTAMLSSPAAAQVVMPVTDAGTFRQMAMSSDAFEIQSSQLAMHRATRPRIQHFAQRMVRDHSMTTAALGGASGPFGAVGPIGAIVTAPLTVPLAAVNATTGSAGPSPLAVGDAIAPRHAAMLSQLAATDGPQFDRTYKRMQIQAHLEAVALFTRYARAGDDPATVSFVRQTLPHLRSHLASARRT